MKLHAQVKLQTGKGVNRRLRSAGSVPAILYGKHQAPVPLVMNQVEIEKVIGSGAGRKLLSLEVTGLEESNSEALVMFKDIERNAITGKIVHVDLYSVRRGEEITMMIPIEFIGEPKDLEKGGTIQFTTRELTIHCLPKDIPNAIKVDLSHIEIGHSVVTSDIVLPDGVKSLDDPGKVIASVVSIRVAETESEEEDEALEETEATETDSEGVKEKS